MMTLDSALHDVGALLPERGTALDIGEQESDGAAGVFCQFVPLRLIRDDCHRDVAPAGPWFPASAPTLATEGRRRTRRGRRTHPGSPPAPLARWLFAAGSRDRTPAIARHPCCTDPPI